MSRSEPSDHNVPHLTNNLSLLDYLRQSQQQQQGGGGGGGGGVRSGYDELDTTLMPPRPGADPYTRNTPSPGTGGQQQQQHPGYTGNVIPPPSLLPPQHH